jgi:subfamily B ATP-binding cassette protein MsbA
VNAFPLYLRILRYFRPYLGILGLTALAVGVSAFTDVLLINLLGVIVDTMRPQAGHALAGLPGWAHNMLTAIRADLPAWDRSALWVIPAAILALALVRMVASFAGEYGSAWLSSHTQYDMRRELFSRVLTLPISYFDRHATGLTLSRIAFDASQVSQAGLNVLTVGVRDSVATAGYLVTLFWLDWQLAIFCLATLPVVGLVVTYAGRRMRRLSQSAQQAMGEMTRVLDESIGGQRVVKVFGGEAYEQKRFERVAYAVRSLSIKQAATSAANSGLIMLTIAITLAVVIYFASLRAQAGALSPGSFVAFFSALMAMQGPIKNLSKINEPLQRGLAAAESVFALMDMPPEPDPGQHRPERARGEIQFVATRFSYHAEAEGHRPALDGISLDIAPGETVALVGASGSGKTTLANLLPRFYDADGGEIRLDGVPLESWALGALRQQIALVSQDVVLFNDTVAANISYGDPTPNRQRVIAAAEAAFADGFIRAMPQGYDTQIGENGTRLSGGQRQRLAIARALYKDAPILILDEATSALDSESERQVQAALERLMQGRTTLVIAHRLSTIERADRIVALRDGRIAEIGSHTELLARDGLYAQLYRQQHAQTGTP